MSLKFEFVKEFHEFVALREEWNDLLVKSSANTIFLTWEWLEAWWQAYRTTEQIYVILFREDNGRLVGVAPFVVNSLKQWGVIRYQALYFWGLNMMEKESEYLDIICESGRETEICTAVLDVLKAHPHDWDVFLYSEVPENSVCLPIVKHIAKSFQWYSTQTSHGCSVIMLQRSYEDYVKSLKPRMRTKVRSLPRRMEAAHQVELEVWDGGEGVEQVMASFQNLHQQRWESAGEFGTFRNPKRVEFYKRFTEFFIKKKWIIIFSLKVDGIYRAHEFGLLYDNKIFILQEGYDPAWTQQGIGNVLRTYSLRYCIEKKYEEYDLLGGVTYHKNSWNPKIKYSVSCIFGRNNFKNALLCFGPSCVEKLKGYYRRFFPGIAEWRGKQARAWEAQQVKEMLKRESKTSEEPKKNTNGNRGL